MTWQEWIAQEEFLETRIATFSKKHGMAGCRCLVSWTTRTDRKHYDAWGQGSTADEAFAAGLAKVEAKVAEAEGREDQAADIPLVSCGGKNA